MGKDGKYVGCKVHDAEDDVLKLYKIHGVLKKSIPIYTFWLYLNLPVHMYNYNGTKKIMT